MTPAVWYILQKSFKKVLVTVYSSDVLTLFVNRNATVYHERILRTIVTVKMNEEEGIVRHRQLIRMVRRWLIVLFCALLVSACQQERKGGPLMAGDRAPDFAAKDIDGNVIVLSSLAGKPVIVRFWETNCRFCRADTPLFNAYFDKYREKGLHIIYVSSFYENLTTVKDFVEVLNVRFPVVMDGEAKLADLYNIKVYPQTFMIGPDRTILANIFGGVSEAEFQEVFGKYLQ